MAQKEATLKIMKADSTKSVNEMTREEREMTAKSLQLEIDARNKELETKVYVVEGGEKAGQRLLDFIKTEANWKFTEAIGVVEVVKDLTTAVENAKGGKELFLRTLPLEALWFFINKVEGVGIEKARDYHENLLKPIGDTLARVKADRDAINELIMKQATYEVGAEFEEPVNA